MCAYVCVNEREREGAEGGRGGGKRERERVTDRQTENTYHMLA